MRLSASISTGVRGWGIAAGGRCEVFTMNLSLSIRAGGVSRGSISQAVGASHSLLSNRMEKVATKLVSSARQLLHSCERVCFPEFYFSISG